MEAEQQKKKKKNSDSTATVSEGWPGRGFGGRYSS